MKTFKSLICVAAMSAVAMLAGCTKDMVTNMNSLPIVAEQFNGGDKAYVSGFYANWENGDPVKFSLATSRGASFTAYTGSISVDYSGGSASASASATGFAPTAGNVVYAGYPASVFSQTPDESVGISLPDSYDYAEGTGNNQRIECPMIGKVDTIQKYEEGTQNPNLLLMKNVCCLLRIKVNPPTSGLYSVDGIKVVNRTKSTPMSGLATIDYTGDSPVMTMSGSTSDSVITLNFPGEGKQIQGTTYFYVPIPPLPSGEELRIYIHNKYSGKWSYNSIVATSPILGNKIATVNGPSTDEPDPLPYEFHEYIKNTTNSSYIALTDDQGDPIKPAYGMKMELTFLVESGISTSQYYAGARAGSSGSMIYYGLVNTMTASDFRACFMSQDAVVDPENYATSGATMTRQNGVIYRQAVEIKAEPNGMYRGYVTFDRLNNDMSLAQRVTNHTTTYRDASADELAASPGVTIFRVGASYQPAGMRMYSYKIWNEDGVLIRNFIPVKRTTDNAIGVYDDVQNTFIQVSTSKFSLGPVSSAK
ncbi:MAG: hypothetical protein IKP21_03285 [Bacteroidales bacterium]|nr:hypothetical protein [Bacteroidales bacterium]